MKRFLLLVVVLAALGLAWLVFRRGDERQRAPVQGPAEDAPLASQPTATLMAPGASSVEERAVEEQGAEPASERSAAAKSRTAFAPPVPPEDGVVVLVVNEASDEPLPHAEVLWLDGDTFTEDEQTVAEGVGFELDGVFERYGRRYRADGVGEVVVPRPNSNVLLAGRLGDLWGLHELRESEEGPVRLELAFDPSLRIRVVDEAGAPVAGVPVAMRLRDDSGRAWDALKASTDEAGLGQIRHVKRLLDSVIDQDVLAAISGVLPEPVEAPVDPADFSRATELVLPGCGALDIRVVRPDGEPAHGTYLLRGKWRETAAPEDAPDYSRPLLMVQDGRARLFPVALGTSFELSLHSLQRNEVLETVVAGPRRQGEVVTVELEVSEARYLLARLVDDDGRPLANTLLRVVLEGERERAAPSRDRAGLRTDADGRLRYEVPEDSQPQRRRLIIRTHSTGVTADERELAAELDLSFDIPPGETDVGDVTLSPPPLIVAGTVVDEGGAAIPRAMVTVIGIDSAEGLQGRTHLWDLRQATSVEGRFEIRGDFPHVRLALSAFHGDFAPDGEHEVSLGTSDVQLVLRAAGKLVARVLLDEDVDREWFYVHAVPEEREHRSRGDLEEDGTAEIPRLWPGLYDLKVVVEETEEVVLRVERLRVNAGQVTDAGELDLRGRLRVLDVTVVDEDGLPIVKGRIDPQLVAEDSIRGSLEVKHGRGRLVTARDPIDVEVSAPDHRTAMVQGLQDDETVVLRRGPVVRVRLRGGLPPLAEGVWLGAWLEGTDEAGRPKASALLFDANGIAEGRVTGEGDYAVHVYAAQEESGETKSSVVAGPVTLHVQEDARAEVEVSIAPDKLALLRDQR